MTAKTHQESQKKKEDKSENLLKYITSNEKGLVFIIVPFYLIF
jgi:hypothetical protein